MNKLKKVAEKRAKENDAVAKGSFAKNKLRFKKSVVIMPMVKKQDKKKDQEATSEISVSKLDTKTIDVCKTGRMWLAKQGRTKAERLLTRTKQKEDGAILVSSKVIALLSKCNHAPVTEEEIFECIGNDVLTLDNVMGWVFDDKDKTVVPVADVAPIRSLVANCIKSSPTLHKLFTKINKGDAGVDTISRDQFENLVLHIVKKNKEKNKNKREVQFFKKETWMSLINVTEGDGNDKTTMVVGFVQLAKWLFDPLDLLDINSYKRPKKL